MMTVDSTGQRTWEGSGHGQGQHLTSYSAGDREPLLRQPGTMIVLGKLGRSRAIYTCAMDEKKAVGCGSRATGLKKTSIDPLRVRGLSTSGGWRNRAKAVQELSQFGGEGAGERAEAWVAPQHARVWVRRARARRCGFNPRCPHDCLPLLTPARTAGAHARRVEPRERRADARAGQGALTAFKKRLKVSRGWTRNHASATGH